MSYNKEWKIAFIKKQTELFAYILYLNNKYDKECNIEMLLNSMLDSGWKLSDKQRATLLKNAFEIAEKQFGLKVS